MVPKKRLNDNIGMMFLVKPIDLIREDGVNAACLPACNNMFDHTFVNQTGKLSKVQTFWKIHISSYKSSGYYFFSGPSTAGIIRIRALFEGWYYSYTIPKIQQTKIAVTKI